MEQRQLRRTLDVLATVNVVDREETDIDREQVSHPSEFPAGEIPDNQNDAAEGLYRRPRQAEVGQDLNTLTTESEKGKTRQKLTEHGRTPDSYHNENQYEDADLKLGENEDDSLSDPRYEPYSQGNGPLYPRYEDPRKDKYDIVLHSTRSAQKEDDDPNKGPRELWICVDLDGTVLSKPEEYQAEDGTQLFGEPLPGAADALRELVDGGARVSIYTARQYFEDDEEWLKLQVGEELDHLGIPYSDIYIGKKPPAHFFVDDRTIPPFDGDWDLVLDAVRDRLKKAAQREFNSPAEAVESFYGDSEEPWTGKIYRSGPEQDITYYHTQQEGAEFYEEINKEKVKEYDLPTSGKTLAIDIDDDYYYLNQLYTETTGQDSDDVGDIALVLEELMPVFKGQGYEWVVIFGETGAEVWGYPVEVVKLANDPVKDTVDYQGIKMDVEWPAGSIRSYDGQDTYVTHMKADYGYARGVDGNDGEELDIYLANRDSDSPIAYIIEQLKDDGSYDEDKIVLGVSSEGEAADVFLQHMPAYMLGDIREVPVDRLVNALYGEPEDRRGQEDVVPEEEKKAKIRRLAFLFVASASDLAIDALNQLGIEREPFDSELAKLVFSVADPKEGYVTMVDRISQAILATDMQEDSFRKKLEALVGPSGRPHLQYPDYTPQEQQEAIQSVGPYGTQKVVQAMIKHGTKTWPEDDIFDNEFTDGTEDRENRDIPRPHDDEKSKYRNARIGGSES